MEYNLINYLTLLKIFDLYLLLYNIIFRITIITSGTY